SRRSLPPRCGRGRTPAAGLRETRPAPPSAPAGAAGCRPGRRGRAGPSGGLFRGVQLVPRILHGRIGRELLVDELAVDLLDLSHIDVLDDLAGLRIDRDGSARTLPGIALGRRQRLVAVE